MNVNRHILLGFLSLLFSFVPLSAQDCGFSIEAEPNDQNYAYSVSVSLGVEGINFLQQAGPSCTFRLNISYDIQITGVNPPANLYTLQGRMFCYGKEIFFNLPTTSGSGTTVSSNENINPLQCDTAQFNCGFVIEIQGPGIGGNQVQSHPCVVGAGAGSGVAPVDFLNFSGSSSLEGINLQWTTANELNNFGFFAQRSWDGMHWEDLGFIAGRGTDPTVASYQFVDASPLAGSNYYRLKQVDYDGTESFSHVVEIAFEPASTAFRALAFPSPIQDQLVLTGAMKNLTIYDSRGRKFMELGALSHPKEISTYDWPIGLYIIRGESPTGTLYIQKLVKNDSRQ